MAEVRKKDPGNDLPGLCLLANIGQIVCWYSESKLSGHVGGEPFQPIVEATRCSDEPITSAETEAKLLGHVQRDVDLRLHHQERLFHFEAAIEIDALEWKASSQPLGQVSKIRITKAEVSRTEVPPNGKTAAEERESIESKPIQGRGTAADETPDGNIRDAQRIEEVLEDRAPGTSCRTRCPVGLKIGGSADQELLIDQPSSVKAG